MNHAPFLAVLDTIDRARRPEVRIQSRPFVDGDGRRMAYVITGPSADAVQEAISSIMGSIPDGHADFVGPYSVRYGSIRSWESKGVVERGIAS